MMRWIWVIGLAWLYCFPSPGQVPSFRRFTGRDGLPQSQAHTLMEDRNGFMWVGTHGGVARLGAQGFQTFGGIPGLKGSRAWALLEGPDGAVWVGYEDGGLARIEGQRVRQYGPKDGLGSTDTFSLALDGNGRLQVGTREGLYQKKGEVFERVPLPAPWDRSPIFSLAADPKGGVWMGSRNGLVGHWDGQRLEPAAFPASSSPGDIQALHWDPRGHLWAMGIHGLQRRDEKGIWSSLSIQGPIGQVRLEGLSINSQGELLVAMGTDGVWQRDPDGGSRILGASDGLPKEGVFFALRDRAGHLWLGTNGDGLSVQGVPGLMHLGGGQGPEMGGVLAFLEFRPGDIFMGGTRGLFRWKEGKGLVGKWGPEDGLPSPLIRALEPDDQGGFWVATTKGLARWKDGHILPVPSPLRDLAITHFQRDGNHLWAATDKGLVELDLRAQRSETFTLPSESGKSLVYSLRLTREGLLVGTMHGIYQFQDGAFRRRWEDAPFATQAISDIHQDFRGRLWIATTKGLYIQEGGAWRRLGLAEGLPDELIFFVGEAGVGRVVVGHGKGGITLLDGPHLLNISQNLGLLSDETNQGGVLLDSRQRLWVGMLGGISRLDTKLLPLRIPLPPPTVEETSWPGGFQAFPKEVSIPPHSRTLDFHWDVGLPTPARPFRYQVKMKGMDTEWRSVAGGHVPQSQLPPGRYQFLLRVSEDGLEWTEAAPVLLQVQAAWYEYAVAKLAMGMVVLGLAGGALVWRIRHLEAAKIELEAKVQERTVDLAASERKAREASLAKSTFLANMSHELRTPLNAVLGFAQLMAREPKQTLKNQESLGRILRAGEHLLGLINDVLSISKIEAGKVTLNLQPFDSGHLIQGIAEIADIRAQTKGLTFILDVGEPFPKSLEGDEGKLRQVLLNLVGNALKFTDKGEVQLRVRYQEGRAHFEVEDSGPGMAPEEVTQLFGAFQQTESGRKQQEGTGLGLHIGQAMIRLMGGEISVRSEVEKGSTFTFAVDLPEVELGPSKGPAPKVLGLQKDQPPLKILVVDDVEENRVVLMRLFGMVGFQIQEARDGQEAVAAWEQWAPEIIWMDIRMPRMNGFEATQRIRSLERERGLARTTVIALTSSAFDHDHQAMLSAGFDAHLGKPFREADLFDALEKLRGVRFRREVPASAAPESTAMPKLDAARMEGLSHEWCSKFRILLSLGDRAGSQKLLDELSDGDLARDLSILVRAYRFEELTRLLGG